MPCCGRSYGWLWGPFAEYGRKWQNLGSSLYNGDFGGALGHLGSVGFSTLEGIGRGVDWLVQSQAKSPSRFFLGAWLDPDEPAIGNATEADRQAHQWRNAQAGFADSMTGGLTRVLRK